jgi:hypothetical protein
MWVLTYLQTRENRIAIWAGKLKPNNSHGFFFCSLKIRSTKHKSPKLWSGNLWFFSYLLIWLLVRKINKNIGTQLSVQLSYSNDNNRGSIWPLWTKTQNGDVYELAEWLVTLCCWEDRTPLRRNGTWGGLSEHTLTRLDRLGSDQLRQPRAQWSCPSHHSDYVGMYIVS